MKTDDLFGGMPEQPEVNHRAQVWGFVGVIVQKTGRMESDVRRQLGSLCRVYQPIKVLNALRRAESSDDPMTYTRALLRGGRNLKTEDGLQAFLNGEHNDLR